MSEFFSFRQCPNCEQRSGFLSRNRIYRCRMCWQFCCDRCITKDWFSRYCPHCQAKESLDLVGAAD